MLGLESHLVGLHCGTHFKGKRPPLLLLLLLLLLPLRGAVAAAGSVVMTIIVATRKEKSYLARGSYTWHLSGDCLQNKQAKFGKYQLHSRC